MSDTRAAIIEAMSAALNEHYANVPNSVPIAVPIARLADAALSRLADGETVPNIPAYDHGVAMQRRWYEPTEHLEQGLPASVGAYRSGGEVVIDAYQGKEQVTVHLPRQDAVEFALGILSASARSDAQVQSEAETR